MDFSLTEEQSMLQDSVAKFIDNDYNFEKRQRELAKKKKKEEKRLKKLEKSGEKAPSDISSLAEDKE